MDGSIDYGRGSKAVVEGRRALKNCVLVCVYVNEEVRYLRAQLVAASKSASVFCSGLLVQVFWPLLSVSSILHPSPDLVSMGPVQADALSGVRLARFCSLLNYFFEFRCLTVLC